MSAVGHRWRWYRSAGGATPVEDFIRALSPPARAVLVAHLEIVVEDGLQEARHLRGEIYEVRASVQGLAIRILFSQEGKKGRILLGLSGFLKKSQGTPQHEIELAENRLRDWRARGV